MIPKVDSTQAKQRTRLLLECQTGNPQLRASLRMSKSISLHCSLLIS